MTDGELLAADELIAIGREVIETLNSDVNPLEIRSDRLVNMGHGPAVYALSQHCLRLGIVALDLHERDLQLEAMPTVRTLYEIAITTQWLAQSREAINAWFNEDVRMRRALSKTLAESASAVFREGADKVAHIDAAKLDTIAKAQGQYFEQRCRALRPGGAHAYALYRAMSWYCHPTAGLTDHYAHEADSPVGLVLLREPDQIGHNSWLYVAVASLVWSGRAVDIMRADSPHRDYLRGVARRLGTSDVLHLTDEALAAEREAETQRRRAAWKGPRPKRPRGRTGGPSPRDGGEAPEGEG